MFSRYLKQIEESDEESIFFLIVSGSGKTYTFCVHFTALPTD